MYSVEILYIWMYIFITKVAAELDTFIIVLTLQAHLMCSVVLTGLTTTLPFQAVIRRRVEYFPSILQMIHPENKSLFSQVTRYFPPQP